METTRGRGGVRTWVHQNETAEAGFELRTFQSRDDRSTVTLRFFSSERT